MPQGPIAVRVVNSSATGNSWFVNEATGNDSNPGNAQLPFKTLDAAQNAAVANNNDVVYLAGTSHRTTPLVWAKNGVSLVGLTAPSDNDRARITTASGLTQTQVTALAPLVDVTAQGCSFVNIGTFYGFDGILTPPTAPICWAEAGGRNFYSNVQFLGGGDALTAALAAMRSITVGGQGENLFVGCTFGLDTIVRATNANATLEFISGTARNIFRQCNFQALVSDASDLHVLVASGGMDRYALFDDCLFFNAVDSTATAMSAAISNAGGSPAGSIILNNCISVGATAIATTGAVYVNQLSAAGATTTFIGLHAT